MSIMRCGLCDGHIDTDEDVEGLWGVENQTPNGEDFICSGCCEHHGLYPDDEPEWRGHKLFMDGNAWCAVPPHFQNLQESPAGFGDTKQEAVDALLANGSYRQDMRRTDTRNGYHAFPTIDDFKVVSRP
ncbi:MAG: hypothetical protein RIA64_07495 [Rhodospirillales bacterium]